MRGLCRVTVLAVASISILWTLPAEAQNAGDVPHGPIHWLPDHNWSGQFCRYPGPNTKRMNATQATMRPTRIPEKVGSHDQVATAQVLTLSPSGPLDAVDVDVIGTIDIGAEVDLYKFTARKGDVFGIAVQATAPLDPVLAIQTIGQTTLIENDDDGGIGFYYPAQSPLPSGVGLYDSALSWIAPADSTYLIRVSSYASASRGNYTMQIRARRPSFETQNVNATQTIFLDFDGATIDAQAIFYGLSSNTSATLSPMRAFLTRWGLTSQDEAAVVDAIVNVVNEKFDELRQNSLNGNLKSDMTLGHFDVKILNSRDDADPWGQPNVSRIIVGGTVDQLGIFTIGIASTIDPGNFSREDTAIVLLDFLSEPNGDPNSINSIGLSSDKTIIDSIGQTVGTIIVHEAGHYLGNWHTDNADDIPCIMDTGGNPIWITIGAGPDGIIGTSDDVPIDFVLDAFDPFERIAVGDESTDVITAFGQATGRVRRDQPPPTSPPTYPLASIRATPTSGSPPLTVDFTAGAIDNATDVSFSWDFTDGSPVESGPVVSHVFQTPGEFLVTVTATTPNTANPGAAPSTGQATVLITVAAQLPTAAIVATPTRGPAPLAVSFDGSRSTTAATDITPIGYDWDFGDLTTGTGAVVSHTYASTGYYAAKLTFTDSAGGTSIATTLITVNVPSSTSLDASQSNPSTSPSNPQCGLGGGAMMIGSCMGLFAIMLVRRRR